MRILFAAPHRLPFLTGSVNLLVLAAWWLWQLAALHAGGTALPQGDLPPVLLHGPAMLFLIFPPFAFGFLLTVFPRWMGFPDLNARDFGPVSALLAAGSVIFQTALWLGSDGALVAGLAARIAAAGQGIGSKPARRPPPMLARLFCAWRLDLRSCGIADGNCLYCHAGSPGLAGR